MFRTLLLAFVLWLTVLADGVSAQVINLVSQPLAFQGAREFCIEIKGLSTPQNHSISLNFGRPANGIVEHNGAVLNRFSEAMLFHERFEAGNGTQRLTVRLENESVLTGFRVFFAGNAREVKCDGSTETSTKEEPASIEKRIAGLEERISALERAVAGLAGKSASSSSASSGRGWEQKLNAVEDVVIEQSRRLQTIIEEIKKLKETIKK